MSTSTTAAAAAAAPADRVGRDSRVTERDVDDELLLAAAYLSRVAEPGSVPLWSLVKQMGYVAAAAAVRQGRVPAEIASCTDSRRERVDEHADLDAAARNGISLIVPDSAQWPHYAFAALVAAAERRVRQWQAGYRERSGRGELTPPLALWTKGTLDLSTGGLGSLAVVGSRASTSYGNHIATDWCYSLARDGILTVSGGAYGIDAAAHRGCLAAQGTTVLVSAGGLDRPYPAGHRNLYEQVAQQGLLISESPPGSAPHRQRFLSRNRIIAALGSATLVVEAASRSGALNTAGYARDLGRPVLAVPGPVSSAMSVGCHELIRRDDNPAILVGTAADVLAYCGTTSPAAGLTGPDSCRGDNPVPHGRPAAQDDPARADLAVRDDLGRDVCRVLDGFPRREAVTESDLARLSGQPIQRVMSALPDLLEAGLITGSREGYRLAARQKSGRV